MASIIGAGKVKYFRFQRRRKEKPKPELKGYRDRNAELKLYGWNTYAEYLASDEWEKIRGKKLRRDPRCFVCWSSPATQVHHAAYDVEVLLGRVPELLVPICRSCHEHIELDEEGNKVSIEDANRRMIAASTNPKIVSDLLQKGTKKIQKHRKWAKSRHYHPDRPCPLDDPMCRICGRPCPKHFVECRPCRRARAEELKQMELAFQALNDCKARQSAG